MSVLLALALYCGEPGRCVLISNTLYVCGLVSHQRLRRGPYRIITTTHCNRA